MSDPYEDLPLDTPGVTTRRPKAAGSMSTDDQKKASALHGEALLAAQDERLRPLLQRLAEATDHPDVRAEVAGHLAGEALAELSRPGADHADIARRLIAAGLAMESGVLDYDRLGPAVREAFEEGR